jgi:hypothetical protein
MMSHEEKLHRTAMSFGAWQQRANKTKDFNDRKLFVHAENALGQAAIAYYVSVQKELLRAKNKRKKT